MISRNWILRKRCLAWIATISVTILGAQADDTNPMGKIKELGIPSLTGKVPAYYSSKHRQHAEKLQSAIEDMNAFFMERVGVQTKVTLLLLDSKDWKAVTGRPYVLPFVWNAALESDGLVVTGSPWVIFVPATTGSPAFSLLMARKEAIPRETLQTFLKANNTTFEAVVDQFVDVIGFHEFGHTLTANFGIATSNAWFEEFLAHYWSYAYISERQPKWKHVFDLLGRPSAVRPQNTSLEDFERLITQVDDYGWYQGMFEARIREIYPKLGLRFLTDLRKGLPRTDESPSFFAPLATRMKPEELLRRLETISPGFQKWVADGFSSTQVPAVIPSRK